jgi:hypothetical protein
MKKMAESFLKPDYRDKIQFKTHINEQFRLKNKQE